MLRLRRTTTAFGLAFGLLTPHAAAQNDVPVEIASAPLQSVIYAVVVNGKHISDGSVMLESPAGQLYVNATDLTEGWRIPIPPSVTPARLNGGEYYALSGFTNVRASIDHASETLDVVVPPDVFERTKISSNRIGLLTADTGTGTFANYDIDIQREGTRQLESLAIDAGKSVGGGLLESQFNGYSAGSSSRFTPQQVSWSRDDLKRHATFRVGSAYSNGGTFGQSVPFTGVQWSTNRATQPQAVFQPLPVFSGVASSPSLVQIYENGKIVSSGTVPTGPFSLTSNVGGNGLQNYAVVVTDSKGNRQAYSEPYYLDASLLRAGTSEFSYGVGSESSQDTTGGNRFIVQALQRRGMSDHLTVEYDAAAGVERLAGANFSWSPGRWGTVVVGAAYHERGGTSSVLSNVGYSFGGRRLTFLASTRTAANSYAPAGVTSTAPLQRQNDLVLSDRIGSHTESRLEYHSVSTPGGGAVQSLSVVFHHALRDGELLASATRSSGGNSRTTVQIGFSRRVGRLGSVFVAEGQGGAAGTTTHTPSVQYQQSAPYGGGLSYAIGTDARNGAPFSANLTARTTAGEATASMINANGGSLADFHVRGGLAFAARRIYPTTWIDSSFAVVEAGYAGVPVSVNNVPVGKTDARGYAFIPSLAPYHSNTISIDPSNLPLGVEVETDKVVVPYPRSGLRVGFGTVSHGSVRFTARLTNGSALPTGADVRQIDGSVSGFVADAGLIYLEGVQPGPLSLRVGLGTAQCVAQVMVPREIASAPDLGTIVCR